VLGSPEYSYLYAKWVDDESRDDTRQAVLNSPLWYSANVEGGNPHPSIVKYMKLMLLLGDEWAVEFFKTFGDKL